MDPVMQGACYSMIKSMSIQDLNEINGNMIKSYLIQNPPEDILIVSGSKLLNGSIDLSEFLKGIRDMLNSFKDKLQVNSDSISPSV